MHCVRCGKEIKEDVVFCPYCGAKQSREQDASKQMDSGQKSGEGAVETAGQAAAGTGETASAGKPAGEKPSGEKTSGEKPSGGKIPVAAIAAGVVVLLAAVGVGAFFLTGKSGKEEEDVAASAGGVSEAVQEDIVETPLYSNVQPGVIDLYAENVNPGEKAAGMGWDNTLFYWLEDCDTTSDADGNIARCRITKTQMFAADNGELIQYEIYHNPDTDSVCKIVSIRKSGDSLTLTDYYYQEGRPNFIFERSDSVYTPTYATIDKVGERYYFNSDVMVRWRMIREPQQIGEYTLNPSDVWYSQADYFAESGEIRGIYDTKERDMLNRAYNTWNAVAADSGIGTVEGYVRDTAGTPVSGAVVNIYRRTDGVLLYQLETGEDGRFQAYVYLNGEECFFTVTGDESVYKAAVVNGLNLTDNSLMHSYDNLVLHKVSGDEYQVHLDVRAANEAKVDEDGVVSCEKLRGVTVNFREGSDSREGEILLTAQAAENGEIIAKLPSGTYTAELVTDGYITTWVNVEVPEQETWCSGWMIPATAEYQTAVVLTWEGEDTDLDLTVFTPNQSTAGDMAHVGGSIAADGRGNLLISDNPSGCEVIYLNTGEAGVFKIYVSDYTDSVGGNYSADRLSAMNVHIYIYNSEGLVEEYTFPAGQNGVVWEVAEVNGRTVTPSQRTYTEISGKNWWTENKGQKQLKKISTYVEEPENGWNYTTTEEYQYDERGNLICYARNRIDDIYDPELWVGEGTDETIEYAYDDENRIIWESTQGNNYYYIKEYGYDAQGNVFEMKVSDPLVENEWVEYYSYDSAGNMIRKDIYGLENGETEEPHEVYHYEYDEQGRMTYKYGIYCDETDSLVEYSDYGEHWEYIPVGEGYAVKSWPALSIGWTVCVYDGSDRLIAELGDPSREGENFSIVTAYTYDDNGNMLTESKGELALDILKQQNISLDGFGEKITFVDLPDGCTRTWTYDEHNNVISEHTLGVYGTSGVSSETWINYSYIYDSYGNVLKKTWVETYVGDGANEQHGYGVSDYEYN